MCVMTQLKNPNPSSSPSAAGASPGSSSGSFSNSDSGNRRPSARTQTIGLWAAAIATFLAVGAHAYLANRHFDLKFGEVNTHSLCNINATFNCEAVSASKFAEFLGVPMAIWGAFTNIALLAMMIFRPLAEPAKYTTTRRNLLLFSGFIAFVSIVMGSISTFLLSALCPVCMLTYLLSFIGFFGLWAGLPKQPTSRHSVPTNFAFGDFLPLVYAAIFIGLGGMIASDQIKQGYGADRLKQMIPDAVNGWEQSAAHPIAMLEPLTGGASPTAAKMTIFEFADYRCPHCKHAAPVMKAFVASHPLARLEFQAWPLDGECNTSMNQTNGASCMLARIVYCAQKTGDNAAGWRASEYIYDTQDAYFSGTEAIHATIPTIAAKAGVDAAQLQACTDSPDTKSMVSKQSAIGTALNLQGTPGIYVNGKEVPSGLGQSMPVLEAIYERITATR